MDDEGGQFYVQPEQDQVRQIKQIEQANPIYSKPVVQQPSSITLKMVQIQRQIQPVFYKPFKIQVSKTESEEQDHGQQYRCPNPFTQFYSKEQLVYQRYDNSSFNKFKQTSYFPGSFVPKNLFSDYLKQDSYSFIDIVRQFYDVNQDNMPQPGANDLVFHSNFQSGNLFAAFKISDRQYDLVMQNDNNSIGNNQWFYFSVQKLVVGAQYTFNVVNFTKSDSLFNYGMTPVGYSSLMHKKNGTQWFHIGKDVSYKKGLIPRQNSRRNYYKLSFKITWRLSNDKLYLAYTFPYTYTKICHKMESIMLKNQDIVTKVTVGKTLSKKNIDALVITQKIKTKKDSRKAIIVMARQHPGQTQGSFVCDGVIDRFISKSKQGDFLRKNYIIYVIPMVNPDGVIFGHYRTNLSGKDLNRKWDSTEKQASCPQVVAIKSFIQQISKQRQIRFILDLHGHSKKLNSFFYGNPLPQSPQIVRIYPYLCSKMNPAVQFIDCTFATQQYKRKAARVYLSYIYKQIHVYTYQVSFHAYFKQGKKQIFTPQQFQNLGVNLVNCLFIMLQGQIKNETRTNLKDTKDSIYSKLMSQLKTNKKLLQIGIGNQSGSDSKPEQGEVNDKQISQSNILSKRPSAVPITQQNQKSTRRTGSKKTQRQPRQYRQVIKPVRNLKFLQISRVNSVLPDRYQLGLQPIKKKQSFDLQSNRNQSSVIRINSHAQTDSNQIFLQNFKQQDIQQSTNLSSSIRIQNSISNNQKKYSSLIKNTRNNNNIIFKIDFINQRSSSTVNNLKQNQKKVLFNAFSQTVVSMTKNRSDRIKSSQLFPIVDSPESQRRTRKNINSIKYETMKIGLKRQTEIFLNGMVKKFLIEKQKQKKQQTQKAPHVIQRPLSIKRKQIYRK